MNKKDVLKSLAEIADEFDNQGAFKSANVITQVMKRVSNTPWWQNEAGEPMYSPEAIRAEERAMSEPPPDDGSDGWWDAHGDNGRFDGEELTAKFNDVYDYWASQQPDIEALEAQYADNLMKEAVAKASPEIERRKQLYPDFDAERYLANQYWSLMNPDLKSDLEQFILAYSPHQDWSGDPDTMHNILDAAKAAILGGADRAGIQAAVDSVPAGNKYSQYEGPEDLGWDGGRED